MSRNRLIGAFGVALALSVLAGVSACGHQDGSSLVNTDRGTIGLDARHIVLIQPASGEPTYISADGTLRLDTSNIPLNDRQRAAAANYYQGVLQIRRRIRSTGGSVGSDGAGIAKDVFSSLLLGNADSIDAKVNGRVASMMSHIAPVV